MRVRIVTQLGGWLFKHRTAIPVPFALALLLMPPSRQSAALLWSGVAVTTAGELLRLLAVRQIGAISRTRAERLGPLVAAGPFGRVRNPLYLGNIAIWLGFGLAAQLPWIALAIAVLLSLEYHAIVRWEEDLLTHRLGDAYATYAARVPRWIPRLQDAPSAAIAPAFTWGETFFSERGTLIAIAGGFLLLWLKTAIWTAI